MNPSARLSASLLGSLVLWAPSALACLRGDLEFGAAGLRYLAAFAAAHFATGLVSRLIAAYRPATYSFEGRLTGPGGSAVSHPEEAAARPLRRSTDQPEGPGPSPPDLQPVAPE